MIDRDRLIAAVLIGGAAFLLVELRFEHREVLGEEWPSWIPLVYCAATLATGAIALRSWSTWGRPMLAGVFLLGVVVGAVGFWFHTGGHLLGGIAELLRAWRIPPGQDGGIRIGSRPPPIAPLAFCGLGTLGWIVSASTPRRPR